ERVARMSAEIRRMDANRMLPGWNYCRFFLLKEPLIQLHRLLGLRAEALAQYDELEAVFAQLLAARSLAWFSPRFGGDQPQDDLGDLLLDTSRRAYHAMLADNSISMFDFRSYLFACQCRLLRDDARYEELAARARRFIPAFAGAMREPGSGRSAAFVAAWTYGACQSIVGVVEGALPQSIAQNHALAAAKAGFLADARRQLDALGAMSGRLPAELCGPAAPDGPSHAPREPLAVSNPVLAEALGSDARFDQIYARTCEQAAQYYAECGRRRFARQMHADVARLLAGRGRWADAARVLGPLAEPRADASAGASADASADAPLVELLAACFRHLRRPRDCLRLLLRLLHGPRLPEPKRAEYSRMLAETTGDVCDGTDGVPNATGSVPNATGSVPNATNTATNAANTATNAANTATNAAGDVLDARHVFRAENLSAAASALGAGISATIVSALAADVTGVVEATAEARSAGGRRLTVQLRSAAAPATTLRPGRNTVRLAWPAALSVAGRLRITAVHVIVARTRFAAMAPPAPAAVRLPADPCAPLVAVLAHAAAAQGSAALSLCVRVQKSAALAGLRVRLFDSAGCAMAVRQADSAAAVAVDSSGALVFRGPLGCDGAPVRVRAVLGAEHPAGTVTVWAEYRLAAEKERLQVAVSAGFVDLRPPLRLDACLRSACAPGREMLLVRVQCLGVSPVRIGRVAGVACAWRGFLRPGECISATVGADADAPADIEASFETLTDVVSAMASGLLDSGLADSGLVDSDHMDSDHTSSDHNTDSGHTNTGHTNTGHTNADHTNADHTNADHTNADHTNTDHTNADHTNSLLADKTLFSLSEPFVRAMVADHITISLDWAATLAAGRPVLPDFDARSLSGLQPRDIPPLRRLLADIHAALTAAPLPAALDNPRRTLTMPLPTAATTAAADKTAAAGFKSETLSVALADNARFCHVFEPVRMSVQCEWSNSNEADVAVVCDPDEWLVAGPVRGIVRGIAWFTLVPLKVGFMLLPEVKSADSQRPLLPVVFAYRRVCVLPNPRVSTVYTVPIPV
ncbi:hypothetical protein LPJ66_009259, partial [Kickxella alabastrina]